MTKKDRRAKGWLTFGSWMSYIIPLGVFAGFNYMHILKTPVLTLTFFGVSLIGALLGVVLHQLGIWKNTSVKLLITSGVLWFLTAMIPNILVFTFIVGGGMLIDDIAFKPNIERIKRRYEDK